MAILRHNAIMQYDIDKDVPLGIFDSGVGGLTVLKAIQRELPNENLIYLGDTARLPYGTKSPASIARYATQATARLQERGIKLLVVACNTASAVALDALRERMSPLPVIGVVEPGAEAALVDLLRQASMIKMLGSYPAALGLNRLRANGRSRWCWLR